MRDHLRFAFLPFVLLACSSSSSSSSGSSDYDPLFATAQAPSPDTTKAIGLWELTQQTTQQGITVTELSRLDIRDGTMKLAARCSSDGYQTITAGVTVSATVAPDAITVNDPGGLVTQQTDGPAGKPPMLCGVQLKGPGKLPYALGNGKLQVSIGSFSKVAD